MPSTKDSRGIWAGQVAADGQLKRLNGLPLRAPAGAIFRRGAKRRRRFCSPECGKASSAAAARARAVQQRRPRPLCEQCERPVKRLANGVSNYGRFCSRQCSGAWKTARRIERTPPPHPCRCGATRERGKRACRACFASRHSRPCCQCGAVITGSRRVTCSDVCRRLYLTVRLTGKKHKPSRVKEYTCTQCSTSFLAVKNRKGLCATCVRRDGRKGKGKFRERCKRAGVYYDPRVTIHAVFQRDKWRCHLCGRKTPARLRGKNVPASPELDHILPITKGGNHTWDNVACACRECNGRKRDKPLGQLRLAV